MVFQHAQTFLFKASAPHLKASFFFFFNFHYSLVWFFVWVFFVGFFPVLPLLVPRELCSLLFHRACHQTCPNRVSQEDVNIAACCVLVRVNVKECWEVRQLRARVLCSNTEPFLSKTCVCQCLVFSYF